jgi:hypothetical protein
MEKDPLSNKEVDLGRGQVMAVFLVKERILIATINSILFFKRTMAKTIGSVKLTGL